MFWRLCKRMHDIIEQYSFLWRHFSPDNISSVMTEELLRILRHSFNFLEFVVMYRTFDCSPPKIDFIFTTELCNAKFLYWLDITDCELSTLCFLQYNVLTKYIEILNLSDCKNLVDVDFQTLKFCKKLIQQYISFTKIRPDTLVRGPEADCVRFVRDTTEDWTLWKNISPRPTVLLLNSRWTRGRANI